MILVCLPKLSISSFFTGLVISAVRAEVNPSKFEKMVETAIISFRIRSVITKNHLSCRIVPSRYKVVILSKGNALGNAMRT